jgi:hypothetical protein
MFLHGNKSFEPHVTPNLEALSFSSNLRMYHVVVTGTHYHGGTDTVFILLFVGNQRGQRWHGFKEHILFIVSGTHPFTDVMLLICIKKFLFFSTDGSVLN